MIAYDIACGCGNIFEGWFHNRSDFQNQVDQAQLSCPICGSLNIRKILSPVRVKTGSIAVPDTAASHCPAEQEDPVQEAIRVLKKLHDYVKENFENVGTKLADESLKMHYGVKERRNICGVATEKEEQILHNEGINLLKIPLPPEDEQLN